MTEDVFLQLTMYVFSLIESQGYKNSNWRNVNIPEWSQEYKPQIAHDKKSHAII